jgi:hypothetical protein|tara:strand:- start:7673 stop:7900 length:228 start_codon:yes stop_codon:yes gene_type:complete
MNFFESADEGTVIKHYDNDTYDVILSYERLDSLINHETRVIYELCKSKFVIKDIKTTVDDNNVWRNTFNVVPNNF